MLWESVLHRQKREIARVSNLFLLKDAFSIADPLVKQAVKDCISQLDNCDEATISWISIRDVV